MQRISKIEYALLTKSEKLSYRSKLAWSKRTKSEKSEWGRKRCSNINCQCHLQSESIEWEKKFDKKFGLLDGESWEPLHTELKAFISQAIASAVVAREREISEAVKKMKTYTGGSSVNEKDKRVNKAEVLSIINPSKE